MLTNMPSELMEAPFRVRYELCRVALDCKVPLEEIVKDLPQGMEMGDHHKLWSWLSHNKRLVPPVPSDDQAWEQASQNFDGISLSGELVFGELKTAPLFTLKLKPLTTGQSCRFFRRFGGDRFLVVTLPCLGRPTLPSHLRKHGDVVCESITRWIINGDHWLFGRQWKAFCVDKAEKKEAIVMDDSWKRGRGRDKKRKLPMKKVYFFAVAGDGFLPGRGASPKGEGIDSHTEMDLERLLEWHIPFKLNKHRPSCKAFARIKQGFSKTTGTVVFSPRKQQIRIGRDKCSSDPSGPGDGEIMNDGCSLISLAAAQEVARLLAIDSDYMPSAFQGRIGGAKGLWIVASDEAQPNGTPEDRGFWIEVGESQRKFTPHVDDTLDPDEDQVTFEVCDWSRPLRSHNLGRQLLPILVNGGVPPQVLVGLLKEGIASDVANQIAAMKSSIAFRKWNQDKYPTMKERTRSGTVKMLGGLPNSESEQVNLLLESGFHPAESALLKDLARRLASQHCDRYEELKINLGKSTYAYCVPDPLGILKPGEVQLSFSSGFRESQPGFRKSIPMLRNSDVLVARSPAWLPSDIQKVLQSHLNAYPPNPIAKVRAVFKPQLSHLTDVIIFSVQGDIPLAKKLSGGDYDGDRVWVTWEPLLVDNFTNATISDEIPPSELGITVDEDKWLDILTDPGDPISPLLLKGFTHNLKTSLLGVCNNWHKEFCSTQKSINSPGAIKLGQLLGHMVDGPKRGYSLTEQNWDKLRAEILHGDGLQILTPREITNELTYYIDDWLGQEAVLAKDKALETLNNSYSPPKRDPQLSQLWREENGYAVADAELRGVLSRLMRDIAEVYRFFQNNSPQEPATISASHARFLDILPRGESSHPTIARWRDEAASLPVSSWTLLRASAAYSGWGHGKFPWWVAGAELCHLKARAQKGARMIVGEVYLGFRVDGAFAEGVGAKGKEGGGSEVREADQAPDMDLF
ncbi:hypothetical protein FGG08_004426 [Glutinoglossum americanum]|uniref:RNA-dependent RNA polymerase n=1 Tax=Glutinoglossum americanum TaxID=1670608 RepID=A0A9P8I568_9PEZI|nr:hypothetical protein FGG08_004426 [Glutinoglossum americanum]